MADAIPLDVYVNDHRVGVLTEDQDGLFVFTYLPGIPADQLISLTMPVRAESYKWGRGWAAPVFLHDFSAARRKICCANNSDQPLRSLILGCSR